MKRFDVLLQESAQAHGHMCSGQVVRDKKEVMKNNRILCRPCAMGTYYTPIEKQEEMKNGKEPHGIAVEDPSGFGPVVLLGSQIN